MSDIPMTKLPDGPGCFTATILSHDEVMALPAKESPLNYRMSSELYHAVFEAIGEASMCWESIPVAMFESDKASNIAVRLCLKICDETDQLKAEVARLREALRGIADMPDYDQDNEHRLRHMAKRALEETK